jgi:hypothetical protein
VAGGVYGAGGSVYSGGGVYVVATAGAGYARSIARNTGTNPVATWSSIAPWYIPTTKMVRLASSGRHTAIEGSEPPIIATS